MGNAIETLQEKLYRSSKFLLGVELVSIRGSMAEKSAVRARTFANQLVESPSVDWVSITDNAGGNPQLAPQALAKPILYAGKEVVIHLTCKDLNRNGLESEAWQLSSEGFHNVLAMTGDYPVSGNGGMAKPVFDLDSLGLISLLSKMNRGFDEHHVKTEFCIGAVTTNYKLLEGELIPQYLKLRKKVECGAAFIINQVGYDSRKAHELRVYMDRHEMKHIPLIGNVFVLSARTATMFHERRIPGIVVTQELLDLCLKQAQSADEGKAFFLEFAAKQMAVFRGLGYRGVYLGGMHNLESIEKILEIERSFSEGDWKEFARKIKFSQPKEFFFYEEDRLTGLADPTKEISTGRPKHAHVGYRMSQWVHDIAFAGEGPLTKLGAAVCTNAKDSFQGPSLLRAVEKVSKNVIYRCKDCGDCSLPEIAFLCPESQCAKNQRNGPCGGTRDGRCEVDGFGDCIWIRAYDRLRHDGKELDLLSHAPVLQDQGLRGTSSWANNWLGRDHKGKRATP
ncbi:MAG: methylenetetrahydrofolate reductase C-terminal domain-containing protein [Bacteroidota bacterium]